MIITIILRELSDSDNPSFEADNLSYLENMLTLMDHTEKYNQTPVICKHNAMLKM